MINLLDLPHGRARALLSTGAPVYLPVNPVEYHGPHLSLHNDALISRGIAADIHAGLLERGHDFPLLMASDLEIGVDPTPGPGSRWTSFAHASALIVEACARLHELGARRVVLMTFHGSPLHSLALDRGAAYLKQRGVPALSPLNLLLRGMLDLNVDDYADAYATIQGEHERSAIVAGAALDFHAGFFETSLAMHHAPDSVDALHRGLPPCPPVTPDAKLQRASQLAARLGRTELSRELDFAAYGTGWFGLRPFPGYTSWPSCASREAGALFASHLKREFAELSQAVLFEGKQPPAPIMRWMASVTLGGTVSPPRTPIEAVGTL